jgi:hypothetical protein
MRVYYWLLGVVGSVFVFAFSTDSITELDATVAAVVVV